VRFDEVLRTFAGFFEEEGMRWAVAGGLAIHAWGHSRTTNDIDFVVDGVHQQRIIGFAESLGYETLYVSNGYSNHEHPSKDFGKIDLLYVYGDTAERLFAGATERAAANEVTAPVLRPEHLAMMKALAMKNRPMRVLIDSPDVAFLLSLPETDRAAVRDYFAKHGLLELFDAIERHRLS
jgi:hypothetical protein